MNDTHSTPNQINNLHILHSWLDEFASKATIADMNSAKYTIYRDFVADIIQRGSYNNHHKIYLNKIRIAYNKHRKVGFCKHDKILWDLIESFGWSMGKDSFKID